MRKMTSTALAAVFIAAGLCIHAGAQVAAPAGPAEVTATGNGSIVGGDAAHAKDDAVEDALRKAVEQTLGTMIQAESLVENAQLIEDRILSKTEGYVQKYSIIHEGRTADDMYEVTVKAVVKTADLKSDLDAIATLLRRKNMPRLVVLIQEQNIGETPGAGHLISADLNTAETAIMDAFMAKGFRFVDDATVQKNLTDAKASAILAGNTAQAAALGKKTGAEFVLSGKALAKTVQVEVYGTTIRSQQATVTVRAIRANTGEVVAVSTAQGKYSHIDDVAGGTLAIQKACAALSQDLVGKIVSKWSGEVTSGNTVTLNVKNVDFMRLSNFKGTLPYVVRGVQSVVQRDFDDGFATLEITFKDKADDLAQRLSAAAFEGYRAKVTGMTEGSVTVELLDKPSAQ